MALDAQVSMATAVGGRSEQQDRGINFFVKSGRRVFAWVGAIFDGFGGSATSDVAVTHLPEICHRHLGPRWHTAPHEHLRAVVHELVQLTSGYYSGSTCSIVAITPSKAVAHVAVLGDSPVLIKRSGVSHLAPMHNFALSEEAQQYARDHGASIERRGDRYVYGCSNEYGGVQLSHCLGCRPLDHFLVREPYIGSFVLDAQSIVLIGSDGLWARDQTPGEWMQATDKKLRRGVGAKALVNAVLRAGGYDNTTAIVWRR